jgi:hypothetical protein
MQMKKILGILLAFCFLMSVTAVAASAHENGPGHWEKKLVAKHVFEHHHWKTVYVWEYVWVANHHPDHHKPAPVHHNPGPHHP